VLAVPRPWGQLKRDPLGRAAPIRERFNGRQGSRKARPTRLRCISGVLPTRFRCKCYNLLKRGGYEEQTVYLATPDIQVHCDSDTCKGTRFFDCTNGKYTQPGRGWTQTFLDYSCRNCKRQRKLFALLFRVAGENQGVAYKLGEIPAFGPPIPARVITMVGPERELFIRGRRSENQGLGIGAFAYYRRVVESQWRRLVEEVLRVARRVGSPETTIKALEKAQTETQFSKAVDDVKDAMPTVLRIDDHNPLTLLHKALSEGLHDRSDADCLELAASIRVVLYELADRIGQALKEEKELKDALGRLLNRST
jgi:hypothetical protein